MEARSETKPIRSIEPRWPSVIAILLTGALYSALPEVLSFGPNWLLLAIVACSSIPNLCTHGKYPRANRILGIINEIIMTLFLAWSVVLLVATLPSKQVSPPVLLRSATALWLCNVVLFALWYWRLDAGGPFARFSRGRHCEGAFLFPPMTADGSRAAGDDWSPRFVDYLFLSFTTSTALSPTDTPVISRWAKALVIVQAMISLTLVVVLAARAVNLL